MIDFTPRSRWEGGIEKERERENRMLIISRLVLRSLALYSQLGRKCLCELLQSLTALSWLGAFGEKSLMNYLFNAVIRKDCSYHQCKNYFIYEIILICIYILWIPKQKRSIFVYTDENQSKFYQYHFSNQASFIYRHPPSFDRRIYKAKCKAHLLLYHRSIAAAVDRGGKSITRSLQNQCPFRTLYTVHISIYIKDTERKLSQQTPFQAGP